MRKAGAGRSACRGLEVGVSPTFISPSIRVKQRKAACPEPTEGVRSGYLADPSEHRTKQTGPSRRDEREEESQTIVPTARLAHSSL
jgi:hypothetical protein